MATTIVTGGGDALQTAITNAVANDKLLIDDGIYNGVVVNKHLTLSSINGPDNCIIDGQSQVRCITNAHTTSWNGYNLYVYGLTLRNGKVLSGDGQVLDTKIGGAGCDRPLIIANCKVLSCYSYSDGGGIRTRNSNSTLSNCIIENCYSQGHGGGVLCDGTTKIYNTYFKDCNCANWGGAAINAKGVYDCTFDHCGTGSSYVLHANNGAGSVVKNCIFKNCYATSNTFNKAIAADHILVNCLIYGTTYGTVIDYSGDIYNCTCFNNTFSGNRAINIRRTASYQTSANGGIGTMIVNNCFDGAGIWIQGTGAHPVHVCNNLIGTTFGKNANVSGMVSADNIIGEAASGFKNKADNDAHLVKGSNLISGGNLEYCLYNEDFEGKYWKDPPSLGAYQYYYPQNDMPNKLIPFGREKEFSLYDSEIEYLETTGLQYVDTGITVKPNTIITASFTQLSVSVQQQLFGVNETGSGPFDFYINSYNQYTSRMFVSSASGIFNAGNGNTYDISVDSENNKVTIHRIGGSTTVRDYTSTSPYTSIYTLPIFNRRNNGSYGGISNGFIGRLTSFKIIQNGIIVRDFIPVRKGTTGYLFDKITNGLFGTLRNPPFILGTDKTS